MHMRLLSRRHLPTGSIPFLLGLVGPNWHEWSHGGTHHLDPHPLSADQWIAPVDGWKPVDWLVPDGWKRSKC